MLQTPLLPKLRTNCPIGPVAAVARRRPFEVYASMVAACFKHRYCQMTNFLIGPVAAVAGGQGLLRQLLAAGAPKCCASVVLHAVQTQLTP